MAEQQLLLCSFVEIVEKSSVQLLEHYHQAVSKSRKRMLEHMLRYLLATSPENKLLDIGPILPLRTPRRLWMKRRDAQWWETIVNVHYQEEHWIETFRMTKETFQWICEQLREDLSPDTNYVKTREPVSVEKEVAIAIFYLSSCCEYRMVGYSFGVHKSTVWKSVHRVVNSINKILLRDHLRMPDETECDHIAAQFESKSNIPQIIGAIDGTHIPILPPSDGYRDFINRKGWPSMVLQAVADNSYRFRNVNCQAPGACHDASILRRSGLFQHHDTLIPKVSVHTGDVPQVTCLLNIDKPQSTIDNLFQKTKAVNGINIPYIIIGDPAYPLLSWLIKGYTKCSRLSPEEESFNVYLNSARVCVEIAFGRLKARWRCLMKRLDVHYSFVPSVVLACCILHNIVETRKDAFVPAWENIVREANSQLPQPQRRHSVALENIEAAEIRRILKDYLAEYSPLRTTFQR